MYLLIIRAAVVIIAASIVAMIAAALMLSTGSPWQMAFLSGGAALGFSVLFFNGIIPPADDSTPERKKAR
jgi:hypothetical protein